MWRYQTTAILLTLFATTGCANLDSSSTVEPTPVPSAQEELVQLEHKIEQLEEVIQEKDAIILKQHQQQQHQAKAQQNASIGATRTQLKLHRLATKPSTASTIAEVDVAMRGLKQRQITTVNQPLLAQAQYLLDAAKQFYAQNEYAPSMNHAAQAYEIINMAADGNRNTASLNHLIVTFQVPVMLRTTTDINLREGSSRNTAILSTLTKNTTLIANAYQGNWFRVQTEGGKQGWVLHSLVETQVSQELKRDKMPVH